MGTVIASDADGDTLAYSITAGNTGTAFAIDGGTGAVYIVDNETQSLVTDEDTESGYLEIAVGPSPRGVIVR